MEERSITIEKIVYGGKGLSRDLQKVVFVPFTIPGEKVRIQLRREHRDYLEADPVEILEPSAERVEPACSYFGRCGGCQISHARYETQVQWKVAMLKESLQRAKVDFDEVEIIATSPFGYRHRAQLKWDAKQNRLGFCERESNRIVDIKECLCLTPGLDRLLVVLRSALLSSPAPKLTEIECYENERGETAIFLNAPATPGLRMLLSAHTKVLDPNEETNAPLMFHFRDFAFPMQPDIFLQINPKMIQQMVMELEGHYERDSEKTAVEFYCGSGLFTLPLSKRFQKMIACEENFKAIEFVRNHYSDQNISWMCEKAESFLIPEGVSVAILDPPRAGLHKRVIENLLKADLKKISYVSCDASSFSRDVRVLGEKYYLKKVTMLDVFPQTFHFETIALLEPKGEKK